MAAANGVAPAEANTLPPASAAPFSYAQAAKRKSVAAQPAPDTHAASNEPTSTTTEPAEAGASWADDSQTMVDGQVPHVDANMRKGSRSSAVDSKSAEASQGGSTIAESRSSSMPKDDEQAPQPVTAEELPWRRRPQEGDSWNDSASDVASTKGDRKDKARDMSNFVAAPAPSVNIWAQRAQDAKVKVPASTPTSSPAPKPVLNEHPAPAEAVDADKLARRNANPRSRSEGGPARGSQRATAHDDVSSRNATTQSTRGRVHVPSMNDAMSWPTPETAKDDEKRKTQSKTESSLPTPTANSKPHSKNEKWVQMDFTPSVKFETPLPVGGRRGGRGGSRGGSRGGFSHSSSRMMNGAAPGQGPEDTNESTESKSEQAGVKSTGSRSRKLGEDPAKASSLPPKPAKESTFVDRSQRNSTSGETIAANDAENGRLSPRALPGTGDSSQTQQDPSMRRKSTKSSDCPDGSKSADAFDIERKRASSVTNGSSKPGWNERRHDASSRLGDRGEAANGVPRGESRPERGRGGKHRGGFYAGHAPPNFQQSPNGHGPPAFSPKHGSFASAGFQGTFNAGRNVRSHGSRSSSFPTETQFSPNPASAYPQSPSMPPPGYYGFPNGPPPNLAPYDPFTQQQALMNGISYQLSYYFSLNNMIKDMYLRSHMTSSGFVPLTVIAGFQRMKQLSTDLNIIRTVAEQSPEFILRMDSDGQAHIRKREEWEQFVLPIEDRQTSAQHDGPAFVDASQQALYEPSGHRHTAEAMFHPVQQPPMYSHFSPVPTGSPVNGFGPSSPPPNRYSMSAIEPQFSYHQAPGSPFLSAQARSVEVPQDDPDAFPDEKIDQLTVVVRPKVKETQQPEILRSTSHGSLDGDLLSPQEDEQAEQGPNGTHKREHSARIADIKKSLTSPPPPSHKSQPSSSNSSNVGLFWIKEQGEEPEQLPANSTYEPYGQVCANALQQRQIAVSGQCPYDMMLLYQFWSHFLLRNFNTRMYTDFRTMAHEDAKQGSHAGLTNLMKYYQDAILSQRMVRSQVAQDYVSLVAEEDRAGERTAFKQLRSAWRNGALNLKNRKTLAELIAPELQMELDR